ILRGVHVHALRSFLPSSSCRSVASSPICSRYQRSWSCLVQIEPGPSLPLTVASSGSRSNRVHRRPGCLCAARGSDAAASPTASPPRRSWRRSVRLVEVPSRDRSQLLGGRLVLLHDLPQVRLRSDPALVLLAEFRRQFLQLILGLQIRHRNLLVRRNFSGTFS